MANCAAYLCGQHCASAAGCGWDSALNLCVAGAHTDLSEYQLCADAGTTSSSTPRPVQQGGARQPCPWEANPCRNGGTCFFVQDGQQSPFECVCPTGFSGIICHQQGASAPSSDVEGAAPGGGGGDDGLFGGAFEGDSFSMANGILVAAALLLVAALMAAVVIVRRRREGRGRGVSPEARSPVLGITSSGFYAGSRLVSQLSSQSEGGPEPVFRMRAQGLGTKGQLMALDGLEGDATSIDGMVMDDGEWDDSTILGGYEV